MKILLVEDSRVLRDRLRRVIADLPGALLVGEVDSESDAVHSLQTKRPDAVVLDLKLKEGSGLLVLEHIKAQYPSMCVLVLTNYGQSEYQERCKALGADYFFDKSQNFAQFCDCLSALVQCASAVVPQRQHGGAL